MALDTLIAGAYTATFNAVSVGITRQGFELSMTGKHEMIDESDAFGLTTIDTVYRGGDCFLQWTSRAYKAGSYAPFWPFGALGVISTTAAPISRLGSSIAQATVLTAVANTPAAAAPATLTASLAILAPNFDGKLLFDSRLREVPVRQQLLPSLSSGTLSWFTTT